jgi:hypothetical protein
MMTTSKGTFMWFSEENMVPMGDSGAITVSVDSAAPGEALDGFGLRSPFLLDLRSFKAIPTFQACCRVPNSRDEYPAPTEFSAIGQTVVPAIAPAAMTFQVLATQIRQVCEPLRWIDADVCQELERVLGNASNDHRAAIQRVLDDLLQAREANRIAENAYWMLSTSGRYLLAHP